MKAFFLCLILLTSFTLSLTAYVSGSNYTGTFACRNIILCAQPGVPVSSRVSPASAALAGEVDDEPAVQFYSSTQGSGNSSLYYLRLPHEPPTPPTQAGTGGTYNFQLSAGFSFGMALCDTQSYPEYSTTCTPDSDTNIYDSTSPNSLDYIGYHPGTAYLELQFYPPGWAPLASLLYPNSPGGLSCDKTKWCAALTIDSYDLNPSTGYPDNSACLSTVGLEPVNFAFITRDGIPQSYPDPVRANIFTYTPNPALDLFMSPGDLIQVYIHDTVFGVQAILADLTSGQAGFMTASALLGFEQVLYEPGSTTCDEAPYSFHPMYATSSVHTRVPWAAHSFNIAFSEEIGHFQYCTTISTIEEGQCQIGWNGAPASPDELGCLPATRSLLIMVTGCTYSDLDFDGPSYGGMGGNWPGTNSIVATDQSLHPEPVMFTSPLFIMPTSFMLQQYDTAGFETDLPYVESNGTYTCTTNPLLCSNPPSYGGSTSFYPIFSTGNNTVFGGACNWQFGGPYIPDTTSTFGGTSVSEYGNVTDSLGFLTALPYVTTTGVAYYYNDYRRLLDYNPCLSANRAPHTVKIGLVPGWNLVSLPLIPASPAITTLLAPLIAKGEVKVVWGYVGTPRKWQLFLPEFPLLSTLHMMTDGNGYWIYMNATDSILENGFVIEAGMAPPAYSLVQGWNLVGFKPQPAVNSSETLSQYFTSITNSYLQNSVYTYNGTVASWNRVGSGDTLAAGEAMWVYVTPATGVILRP